MGLSDRHFRHKNQTGLDPVICYIFMVCSRCSLLKSANGTFGCTAVQLWNESICFEHYIANLQNCLYRKNVDS